jgi:hypothetical protein
MRRTLAGIVPLGVFVLASTVAAQDTTRARPAASGAHSPTSAPQPVHAKRILGIFDAESGNPLEDAEVVDLFVDNVYRTQSNGLVGLWALTSRHDSVAVRVRKIGYVDTAFVVMLSATDSTPVPIYLGKVISALPAVVTEALATKRVSSNMADFAEFRKLATRAMDPVDMRKVDNKPITDILHDLTAGKARGCRGLRIFVDGAPQELPDNAKGSDYEGIEFYTAASAPMAFRSTSKNSCGVLLLFSREKA